jgi:hypothetical protein
MKKAIILLSGILITSCGASGFGSYPTTTFYVKNNSNETIDFSSTIVVFPMSRGPLTRSFSVPAKDSILARQVDFKKDTEPQKWFLEFKIFPNDNVKIFDPNNAGNWKKSFDIKGRPNYTFLIAE